MGGIASGGDREGCSVAGMAEAEQQHESPHWRADPWEGDGSPGHKEERWSIR